MVIEIVDIFYSGNNSENKIDMYFAEKKVNICLFRIKLYFISFFMKLTI